MLSTQKGFSAFVYLAASQESLVAARQLLEAGRYVMAAYIAGVAVESLLLAYQAKAGMPHDAWHNVQRLAENGRFWDNMPRKQKEAITAELGEVATRWRNDHRYRSEKAFRDWLVANKLFVIYGNSTVRQDVVSFNADLLVEAAQRIIEVGVARWPSAPPSTT